MNDELTPHTDSTDPELSNRYAKIELPEETTVVYDREQTHAWIQSDVTMPTETTLVDATNSELRRDYERHLAAKYAESPVTGDKIDG